MGFVNSGISIRVPSTGNFQFQGIARVAFSGTGTMGSLVWCVTRLVNRTSGVELPNSRVLATLIALDSGTGFQLSSNQGLQYQVSSPIGPVFASANAGDIIDLQVESAASFGGIPGSFAVLNDSNGASFIAITS